MPVISASNNVPKNVNPETGEVLVRTRNELKCRNYVPKMPEDAWPVGAVRVTRRISTVFIPTTRSRLASGSFSVDNFYVNKVGAR